MELYSSTTAIQGSSISANGTFTTTDVASGGNYTITGITGTVGGDTITSLLAPGSTGSNDNLISTTGNLDFNGFSFGTNGSPQYWNLFLDNSSTYKLLNSTSAGTGITGTTSDTTGTFTAISTTSSAVPFEIPFGATIPAIGSVLALGVMRKARKSTSNTFSITTTEKVN